MNTKWSWKNAFTLIEIMIVIGIVGMLAAATTIAYGNHLQSTRDAKRKLDLEEIRIALEKHRTNESQYPADYIELESDGYMSELPEDPREPHQSYTYTYDSTDDLYELVAELENSSKGQYYIVSPKGSVYRDTPEL